MNTETPKEGGNGRAEHSDDYWITRQCLRTFRDDPFHACADLFTVGFYASTISCCKTTQLGETPRESVRLGPQYRENPGKMPTWRARFPPYPGLSIGIDS